MDSIFGIPMNGILVVLLIIMGICLLSVAAIAIFNPIIFKMALRNPPRRKPQTVLILIGLMLATLIVSAALTTGDTLDHTLSKGTYQALNRVDITIGFVGQAGGQSSTDVNNEPIPASLADELSQQFADNPDIESFMPVLTLDVPAINQQERLSEPSAILAGLDWSKVAQIGGIETPDGEQIDLSAVPPEQAIISETLSEETNTQAGDTLTIYIMNQPFEIPIYAVGEDSILTGINFGTQQGPSDNGLAMSIDQVQQISGLEGQARYIAVTLPGGPEGAMDHTEEAEADLEAALQDTPYGVNPIKRETIEGVELLGNLFTSLFLVMGLFSIAAGILLIFLIFTMLSAERRPEMGMARAVGMRQSWLVQQFIAEGTLYDLGAALIGAVAGVGVTAIMVQIITLLFGDFLPVELHFTWRSLAVAYALGVSVTFLTIIFASARAARLNVVSAIRDLPEPERQRTRRPRWDWWKKIPRFGPTIPGIHIRVISLFFFPIELIPNLLIYPIRFAVWILRLIAHYIGWGPLLVPLGALLMLAGAALGDQGGSLALYTIGFSLLGLGIMLILRQRLPERAVFTVGSIVMLIFWLSTDSTPLAGPVVDFIMPDNLVGDFDMFFVSGIMMVTFSTLLIVYNAEAIVWFVSQFGRAFSRWVPAVKTAVAYPLASKTKTGLTLAMFSLIMFSLAFMSTMNANLIQIFSSDDATGGWDIYVTSNSSNPIGNLRDALAGSDVNTEEFTAVGKQLIEQPENVLIREPAEAESPDDWQHNTINGVDQEFALNTSMPMRLRAEGYETDEEIWQAIAENPDLAVIDSFTGGPATFGGGQDQFYLGAEPIKPDGEIMQPVTIEISDPGSETARELTIIGVIDDTVSTAFGVYTNIQTFQDVFGQADTEQIVVQLSNGDTEHAEDVAKQIEAALLENGAQATPARSLIEDVVSIQSAFLNLIQGFMGLGLLVGIAALGVISFRAVVERRQQIGMLRAIGFQKGMIGLAFLLESIVVAGLGVLAGLALALILAYNLFTSEEFTSGFTNFIIPWGQLILIVAIALIAAALMTIIPSRSAASVPVADALRYE